jgi:hypothetical protein
VHEFDLRAQSGPVHGPDQVGSKHEAALEHGDNQQVDGFGRGDSFGDLAVAPGNGSLVIQHADAAIVGHVWLRMGLAPQACGACCQVLARATTA